MRVRLQRTRVGERRVRRRVTGALIVVVALLATACGGSSGHATGAPSHPPLPSDFLGIVTNDAFAAHAGAQAQILADERRTGVELVRETFDWAAIEPTPGRFDFSRYDAFMVACARAGLRVLPIVFGRPRFEPAQHPAGGQVSATTTFAPARLRDFAVFAAALARRYGPHGTFWRSHPTLAAQAIRSWQIWNEPNLPVYWGGRPDAAGYVAMLTAAARAIRVVDPGAEIVTAGIPDSSIGVPLNRYVRAMLAAGAARSADTLAINPYASSDSGVVAATEAVRQLLDEDGHAATRIWVTEIGWASGGPGSSFTVGAVAQARFVLGALTTLGRLAPTLRLRGVVYFDWRDAPPYPGGINFWGLHTGLVSENGIGKAALSAFYQAAGVLGALPR